MGLVGDVQDKISGFNKAVMRCLSEAGPADFKSKQLRQQLQAAFVNNGDKGVSSQLRFALQAYVANYNFTRMDIVNHANLADLRYPYEWYARTRSMEREIHLHVGPTNSGKTYHALKRLEEAKSGVYAGPLRLLAYEVYSRLNAKGKKCHLVTGDERIIVEGVDIKMSSCTVEMVPLLAEMDVAVIDEIQMIGNVQRGWAWTNALLGLRAKEIHLCGEERALPIVRDIAAGLGEKLIIHRYERLSPLKTMNKSLDGNFKNLRKGDCVVAFSRKDIYALKHGIQDSTGKKCAVVYGALPPETRAQQAKLFNDPDNDYDILVASDAIGMGLNLGIKRIVFETTIRFDGNAPVRLPASDIKQIAGRAGRYRVATDDIQTETSSTDERSADGTDIESSSNIGLVTTLEKIDFPIVKKAMLTDPSPITAAGILAPDEMIIRFAAYFPPETPLSYIMLRLQELSRTKSRFSLCSLEQQVRIADIIQVVKGLSISQRLAFCASPGSARDPELPKVVVAFAKCVAGQGGGELLDIAELPLNVLDYRGEASDPLYIKGLESLHRALVLYLWLSYRFNGVFTSQELAFHTKHLVEQKIDQALAEVSYSRENRLKAKQFQEQSLLRQFQEQLAFSESGRAKDLEPGESSPWIDANTGENAIEDPATSQSPVAGHVE